MQLAAVSVLPVMMSSCLHMWLHLDYFAIDSVSLAVSILASYPCRLRFNYLAVGSVSPAAPYLCRLRFDHLAIGGASPVAPRFAVGSVSPAAPYLCRLRFDHLAVGGVSLAAPWFAVGSVSPAAPRLYLYWQAISAGCGLTTLPSAVFLRLRFSYTILLLATLASVQQSNHRNGQRLVAMFSQMHRAQ